MAVLFWGVSYKYGMSWTTMEYLILTFGLVVVSFIDFDHMILPDTFTLSGIVIGLVGAALSPEREFSPFMGFYWEAGFCMPLHIFTLPYEIKRGWAGATSSYWGG
ncbi:MAG: prepilin peptidase [Bdellovibrionales bacterium]